MELAPLVSAANKEIQAFLSRHSRRVEGWEDVWMQPRELQQLQCYLATVGGRMGELLAARGGTCQPELSRYIHNLGQLRGILETAQEVLTARRKELAERKKGMQRAREWASACKATL
jgi:hypothetical protein